MKVLDLDCKYPTKDVNTCIIERLLEPKKEYIKVYCSNCIDGEIVYKTLSKGYYCTNPSCRYYTNKIYIKEV